MGWRFWRRESNGGADTVPDVAHKPAVVPPSGVEGPRKDTRKAVDRALSEIEGNLGTVVSLMKGQKVKYKLLTLQGLNRSELKIGDYAIPFVVKLGRLYWGSGDNLQLLSLNQKQRVNIDILSVVIEIVNDGSSGPRLEVVNNADANVNILLRPSKIIHPGDGYRRIPFELKEDEEKVLVLEPGDCWETDLLYGSYKFPPDVVRSEHDGVFVNGKEINEKAQLNCGLVIELKSQAQHPKMWLYNDQKKQISIPLWARRLNGGEYTREYNIDESAVAEASTIPSLVGGSDSGEVTAPMRVFTPETTSIAQTQSIKDASEVVVNEENLMVLDKVVVKPDLNIKKGAVGGLSFPGSNFTGNYMVHLIQENLLVSVEEGSVSIDGVAISANNRFERRANIEFALRTMPVPSSANRYLLLIRHPTNTSYNQPITIS